MTSGAIAQGPFKCGDCGVLEGELHKDGCDMERCPLCGRQLITCGCCYKHFYPGYVSLFERADDPARRMTDDDRAHVKECSLKGCRMCDSIVASGKTGGLPVDVYMEGLRDDQADEWDKILETKGRVPWIRYPNLCVRCGALWPAMFHVSDEDWDKYVQPAMRDEMLCRPCFYWIKGRIDAWSNKEKRP